MTDFDRFDDVAEDAGLPLTPNAKERVRERLMRLNEDPVRIEVGDPEVVDFTERQFGRVIGDNGEVVRGDFEPFRPSVGRDDLFLFGSVGDDGDNNPADVFKVKKLLQRAAGAEFRPGIDGLGEADPRTVNTLRNIQGTNNLKVDGRVEPGGPTLHALGFRALGPENGRPTPLAAHEFETRFGKPADRDERRQPIFSTGGRTETEVQLARFGRGGRLPPPARPPQPPRPPRPPRGGGPKKGSGKPIPSKAWKRHLDELERWLKTENEFEKLRKRFPKSWETSERPARIFRYPDGRVYLNTDRHGKPLPSLPLTPSGPSIETDADTLNPDFPDRLKATRDAAKNFLPDLNDTQSHEERSAAGKEGIVRGPAFDENGVFKGWVPLRDPSTLGLLDRPRVLRTPGADTNLSLAEIKRLGLWRWYSDSAKPRRWKSN